MSFNLTAGNPRAHRIRVYYEGSDAIREGMPVCYNWDTTDNWFGGSVTLGEPTATGTTLDGSHNEGRYIRVEAPAADNLQWFAGVVAKGKHVGKAGPASIDIYVPNGAVVPVYTDQTSVTVGRTVLCLKAATLALSSAGRPVAIVEETLVAAGLCLAKLDPSLFLYESNASTTLLMPATTSSQSWNVIDITSQHTGGYATALTIKNTFGGVLAATGGGAAIIGYLKTGASITSTTAYIRSILGQLDHTGGTLNGSNLHVCGVMAQVNGNGTLTAVSKMACLMCDMSISGSGPTAGDLSFIRCANNNSQNANVKYVFDIYGGYGVGNLFNLLGCTNTGEDTSYMVFAGGTGTGALSTGGAWKKIRVVIEGSEFFLVALPAPTSA